MHSPLPAIIYNVDPVVVTLTGALMAPNPAFCGVAYIHPHMREPSSVFWTAAPSPLGYTVTLTTHLHGAPLSGAIVWEGPTYNLALEVAAACYNWATGNSLGAVRPVSFLPDSETL